MHNLILTPLIWSIMVVLAAIIDFFVGDPQFLYHPVILIGNLIKRLTKLLNTGKNKRLKGLLLWLIVFSATFSLVLLVELLIRYLNYYLFLVIVTWLLSTALAEKSLYLAGQKCESALRENDLERARKATGEIVGRETSTLSEPEIIRAVVETEAENGIDGIIAPLFYMFLGILIVPYCPLLNPLVLAYCYKAVNTLDSMVGYIYEPYKDFGFYSAKIDDIANFLPARIGSVFIIFAGGILGYDLKNGFKIFFRDRRNHLSPNSAQAESAIAGLLNIQLGGSNTYFGHKTDKPTIGDRTNLLKDSDIKRAMNIVLLGEILFIFFGILFIFLVLEAKNIFIV